MKFSGTSDNNNSINNNENNNDNNNDNCWLRPLPLSLVGWCASCTTTTTTTNNNNNNNNNNNQRINVYATKTIAFLIE